MNNNMPRTPLSTRLSKSARETELRLKNIFSGPKKRPPALFLALMFSVCVFCGNIVSCQFKEETPPDVSDPASSSQEDASFLDGAEFDARLNKTVLDYLQAEYNTTVYLAENTPEEPQERDLRLDSVYLIGMDYVGEDLHCLYQVTRSEYSQRMGELEWQQYSPTYLVTRMDNGIPVEPLYASSYNGPLEDMSSEEAIRQVKNAIHQTVWSLTDLEVCLFRDGFSTPIGLGNWVEPMFLDLTAEAEIFEEGDPIYYPGDYWENWTADGGAEEGGVSALRYYSAGTGSWSLQRMETGRTDMYTPRGIRVGSTREEVLAAYPGLLSDEENWYWGYPNDYLWYCADENGLGPHLCFFFTDDVVFMIQMVDLFN